MPYLPIDIAGGTVAEIDGVVASPHKFIGGPGASGILVLRRYSVVAQKPSLPGGGIISKFQACLVTTISRAH